MWKPEVWRGYITMTFVEILVTAMVCFIIYPLSVMSLSEDKQISSLGARLGQYGIYLMVLLFFAPVFILVIKLLVNLS